MTGFTIITRQELYSQDQGVNLAAIGEKGNTLFTTRIKSWQLKNSWKAEFPQFSGNKLKQELVCIYRKENPGE
ncbi:hypothetical protein [Kosakonia radicincitans]|uniref:hypothetical protein n=1 Tax=Kosakonia radicincitans TaxID=283686 RepID=UPI0012AB7627|nr:hypothetical protein [Kosakonia radicincitans]